MLGLFSVPVLLEGVGFLWMDRSSRAYTVRMYREIGEAAPPAPSIDGLTLVLFAVATLLTVAALSAAFSARRRRPDGPRPTVEFLAAALPRLDLAPPERVHAETLVRTLEGGDPFVRGEILPALRSLCGEWARLDGIERSLATPGPDEGEVAALRLRLAEVEDPVAGEALAQSLATAERRAAASLSTRAARERLDAHRETIRQSSLEIAETAARTGSPPLSADPAFEALRGNVARASRDVAALEAAVREMRAG